MAKLLLVHIIRVTKKKKFVYKLIKFKSTNLVYIIKFYNKTLTTKCAIDIIIIILIS